MLLRNIKQSSLLRKSFKQKLRKKLKAFQLTLLIGGVVNNRRHHERINKYLAMNDFVAKNWDGASSNLGVTLYLEALTKVLTR